LPELRTDDDASIQQNKGDKGDGEQDKGDISSSDIGEVADYPSDEAKKRRRNCDRHVHRQHEQGKMSRAPI
jgi:hypothetical protein